MEEERESTSYWCHECSRVVDPIMEVESIKCSLCHSGFVEEMDSVSSNHHQQTGSSDDRAALSLWAPILLGMMSNPRRRRRFRFNDEEDRHDSEQSRQAGESDPNLDPDHELERERVILINPFNQTIIIHNGGSGGGAASGNQNQPIGSFGDYFIGPGLELLLQHLAENDPNRYGTPPAQKEAVEAMPTVTIDDDSIQCSVCLEDFEAGVEAKEMPCKHRFHGECILPWLELHSSCPVCRYQLPADELKINREREPSRGSLGNSNGVTSESENGSSDRRQFSLPLPWPFSGLFSSSSGSELSPRAHVDDRNSHSEDNQ